MNDLIDAIDALAAYVTDTVAPLYANLMLRAGENPAESVTLNSLARLVDEYHAALCSWQRQQLAKSS